MHAAFERSDVGGAALRAELAKAWPDGRPKVLDCFAGGGAIPLEAVRLGCEVHAVDINPVAHLVQLATLDYPMRFGERDPRGRYQLVEDVKHWSAWVGERAEAELAPHFPASGQGPSRDLLLVPDDALSGCLMWSRDSRCSRRGSWPTRRGEVSSRSVGRRRCDRHRRCRW